MASLVSDGFTGSKNLCVDGRSVIVFLRLGTKSSNSCLDADKFASVPNWIWGDEEIRVYLTSDF